MEYYSFYVKLQVISSLGFLLVLIGVGISYFVKGDNFNFHVFGKTFRYFWTRSKWLVENNSHRDNKYLGQEQSNIEEDPFVLAVRIANITSDKAKTAKTSTQWLELAASWERASYLMSLVSPRHSRYKEAQIRTKLYKKYSEAAQKEAEKTQF